LQEQVKSNGYLQLESTIGTNQSQASASESHLVEIKAQLNEKKKEIDNILAEF
jgi:hypothetical protein